MINFFLIIIGKLLSLISTTLKLGNGSTWPGHIALTVNKNFIRDIIRINPHLKIILIAGTNGKTTTGKLISTILEKSGYRAFQNESGANLLNGITSSLLLHSSILSTINYNYAIFEVDENTLPLALKELTPNFLILLNLFRDQLDRYGEVNTILDKWKRALKKLTKETVLILSADDPQIAYLGVQANTPGRWNRSYTRGFYFGLDDNALSQTSQQHAVDSTYCPKCNSKLTYINIYYSHLGNWICQKCLYKRPKLDLSTYGSYPLQGIYNRYNVHAAVLLTKIIGIKEKQIEESLKNFNPSFGRQEVINVKGKKVQIFLSKNPTSFNESLRTIASLNAKNVLFVLDDRIPDGRDVSWIWDVDFEDYVDELKNITVSGDRCYDMGLRIKYAIKSQKYNSKFKVFENLREAIKIAIDISHKNEMLYILPTYSAMLEVRKILTGKKIL